MPNKFEDSQSNALHKANEKEIRIFSGETGFSPYRCVILNSFLKECVRDPFCLEVFLLVNQEEFYFLWIEISTLLLSKQ